MGHGTVYAGLVLAGTRGEGDPLAQHSGAAHRALIPVAGVPMLARALRALQASLGGELMVSIDDPAALDAEPELARLVASGALRVHTSLSSPARSVLDALESLAAERVLVTTADHALLRAEIVEHFLAGAEASGADVAVGVVTRDVLEARFPGIPRTWLRFRDAHVSGANLFAFRSEAARRAAAFWIRAERLRKRPWRLVSVFGPSALLRFALGRLDLDAALARASEAMGATLAAVRLPFAEAAVDVDRLSDLALATRLLEEAQSSREPSAAKPPLAGS